MPRLLHHISVRYPRWKLCPRISARNGTRFPKRPRSGNYIPESALELGCTFPIEPHGKLRPTLGGAL